MCILLIASQPPDLLVVCNNRDEFLDRETLRAAWREGLLGGRDAERGGMWLGLTARGQFACVTNVHREAGPETSRRSRGWLVQEFLQEGRITSDEVGGFSVVHGSFHPRDLHLLTNHPQLRHEKCTDGCIALSNARPGEEWKKLEIAEEMLGAIIAKDKDVDALVEDLFGMLSHDTLPDKHDLHGVRDSIFIPNIAVGGRLYGTRQQTVIVVAGDRVTYCERDTQSTEECRFHFTIQS